MDRGDVRLGALTLQPGRQLLMDGAPVALRKKPLEVLTALAGAGGALVTKDELIDAVWPGRIVEESALHAHIVSLRKALGPEADRLKTVYGMGYRLDMPGHVPSARRRRPDGTAQPTLAVLPLHSIGEDGDRSLIADALPHELIAELSRLRWLFVIARASSFQFRDPHPDIGRIGDTLGVGYCLSGTIEREKGRFAVTIELADTRSLQVVWGERYSASVDDVFELRARIVAAVASALEFQIPVHEAQRAAPKPPDQLDAWELYHMALQRVFRSTAKDNAAAGALFAQAASLDPGFARAQAGLSFTHFQNAFMHYVDDTAAEAAGARNHAERALELDAADPFANLVMGRSLWLTRELAASRPWIDRALSLNPNYAQGAYAHAFADAILCDGAEGQRHADRAMALSPIDPMHYAMMGARALSHAVRGEDEEAAEWSDRAARAPNSHVLIAMIALVCQTLAGREHDAARWAEAIRTQQAELGSDDFFRAFPFADDRVRSRFSQALARHGLQR